MPITSLKIKERPQLLARGNYGERKGEKIPPGGNHHPKMTAAKEEHAAQRSTVSRAKGGAPSGAPGLAPHRPISGRRRRCLWADASEGEGGLEKPGGAPGSRNRSQASP